MNSIAKTTRLPSEIIKGIKYRTKREGIDDSTSLRQLLHIGIKEYVIKLYKQGEISLREAAQITNLTIRDMLDILLEHGIKGNIKYDVQQKSLEIIKEL